MPKPAIYYPALDGIGSIQIPKLRFLSMKGPEGFNDFSPIVVLGGTLDFLEKDIERNTEAARVEREIFNSLNRGSVVCLTSRIDDLVRRVMRRVGVCVRFFEDLRVDLAVRRSEFSPFYKEFGTVATFFHNGYQPDDIICETKDKMTVGFAKKVGKGALLFLPCHMLHQQFSDYNFLNRFLTILFESLKRYGPKIQYTPPNWIDSLRFPRESLIVTEMKKFQKELNKRDESLKEYLKLKEILWFRDNELVISVMNFLNKMGIKTKRDEIHEEDFWIIEQGKETVIVEVKGLDKNLKRPHISKLDEHRAAREKLDSFPALLVVNSFNKATSLEEKDKPISSNEIKKAVRTNVLILRTLDLHNAYSLMEETKLEPSTLLNAFRSESGWLKITHSGLKLIKQ